MDWSDSLSKIGCKSSTRNCVIFPLSLSLAPCCSLSFDDFGLLLFLSLFLLPAHWIWLCHHFSMTCHLRGLPSLVTASLIRNCILHPIQFYREVCNNQSLYLLLGLFSDSFTYIIGLYSQFVHCAYDWLLSLASIGCKLRYAVLIFQFDTYKWHQFLKRLKGNHH